MRGLVDRAVFGQILVVVCWRPSPQRRRFRICADIEAQACWIYCLTPDALGRFSKTARFASTYRSCGGTPISASRTLMGDTSHAPAALRRALLWVRARALSMAPRLFNGRANRSYPCTGVGSAGWRSTTAAAPYTASGRTTVVYRVRAQGRSHPQTHAARGVSAKVPIWLAQTACPLQRPT